MMMMPGRIVSCCVALLLTLTSVSAVRRALNSISDLKSVGFGQSVPEHSLVLLHWFANTVDIDRNGVIRLTFDPESGDYGSHHYGNYDELLDPLPRGYQYYTLGNVNQDALLELPHYVQSDNEESNRARIIIRVRKQNVRLQESQIIDQIYITQHYETFDYQRSEYDPEHTYKVTAYLLRAIQKFSLEGNNINLLMSLRDHFQSNVDDSQLWEIIHEWNGLACLGLLLFIVVPKRYTSNLRFTSQAATQREIQRDSNNIWIALLIFILVILFIVLFGSGYLKQ